VSDVVQEELPLIKWRRLLSRAGAQSDLLCRAVHELVDCIIPCGHHIAGQTLAALLANVELVGAILEDIDADGPPDGT